MARKKKTTKRPGQGWRVQDLAGVLDELCSDLDPIYVGGVETTPRDLGEGELAGKSCRDVPIKYHALADGCLQLRRGTLYSMVQDRLRNY